MEQTKQGAKPLDTFAVSIGEHLRAKGFNLTALTEELTKQGYTKSTGDRLDTTTVSVFLCANGAKAPQKRSGPIKGSPEAHERMAKIRAKRFEGLVAKPLDRAAFENIAKPVREAGGTMHEVCEALKAAGYTKKSGRALCPATASHFLIACGMRTYDAKPRKGKANQRFPKVVKQLAEPVTTPAVAVPTGTETLMLAIATNNNLTKQQKIQMMQALV